MFIQSVFLLNEESQSEVCVFTCVARKLVKCCLAVH